MGFPHLNRDRAVSRRCFSERTCLRKACGRKFVSRRWNQRYCQDGNCLRLVKLWLDRKRQRRCRESEAVRQRHCERERERRAQERVRHREQQSSSLPVQDCSELPKKGPIPQITRRIAARGHAGDSIPEPFCDRPGCYEAVRQSLRTPGRYCGDDCCRAMRRVFDRERKWLRRRAIATRRTAC